MLSPPNSEFYHPSICHVCKSRTNVSSCGNCKSISYCSKAHQSADWPQHKKLCKIISYTDEIYTVEMQSQYEDQDVFFNMIKNEWKVKLKRDLTWFEIELLMFRKYCGVCNARNCTMACHNCTSVFYCSLEHLEGHWEKHRLFCGCLKLNLELFLHKRKAGTGILNFSNEYFKDDLKQLPNTQVRMFTIMTAHPYLFFPREQDLYDAFVVIDLFAPILSILCGLEKGMVLKDRMLPKDHLIVHIVGADEEELSWNWDIIIEFVYHWIKNLKKLTFILIGPEVKRWYHYSSNHSAYCETCQNNKINANCFTLTKNYHDVVNSLGKPDVIVAFNCGLFATSSWIPSIGSLTNFPGVPLVLTDYTMTYLKDDLEAIRNCTKRDIQVVLFPQWNRYACVSSHRHLELKTRPIFYKNGYITVLVVQ